MRRTVVTLSLFCLGIAAMVTGFLTAAPWGADRISDSDPTMAFAPTLFVVGVILAVAAPVVYSLIPDRSED